jgi:hypothetical protein
MSMTEMEIWKEIPGVEGYQVSNIGRFKSIDRITFLKNGKLGFRHGRIIKIQLDPKGYYQTNCLRKKYKLYLIHRMVAMAFIPNPNNLKEVNHINGIKTDNRVENLEWANRSMQMLHAYSTGLRRKYCHANERWATTANNK